MKEAWTTCIDWHPMSLYMKLQCPVCEDRSEFSGDGALFIRCPSCRTVFKLPTDIPLEKVEGEPEDSLLEADTENVDP